jgi:hypothetical protein
MPPDTNVSLEMQIPEELHDRIQGFLDRNPAWHYDDFTTAALSLLLMILDESSTAEDRWHLERALQRSGEKAA